MKDKLFHRDFTLVIIGQIVSLFGNCILQYALPLYLLTQTHSAALYGIVSALAFIPMILFTPIGGFIADRVNKRNIMVALDFSTAFIMTCYTFLYHHVSIVTLLIIVLMCLYGIQGAYQPTVQASIPLLVSEDHLNSGNAIVNMISSLAGIIGPALGGVLYGFAGLQPILIASILCFVASAVMEIFIHIPYTCNPGKEKISTILKKDAKESVHFVFRERPEAGKFGLLLSAINLVFSSLIVIGLPVIINEYLGFDPALAARLYGYTQSALAAGGLFGGLLAGILGKHLKIKNCTVLFVLCTLALLPIASALFFHFDKMTSYIIITISCFVIMILSSLLQIVLTSYIQVITPSHLLGKVMALLMFLCMCAHPLGQAVYGVLLESFASEIGFIFLVSFLCCMGLCIIPFRLCRRLKDPV